MKILIVFSMLLLMAACRDDKPIFPCSSSEVGFAMYFVDKQGNDLLDPATTGAFKHDEIKVFKDKDLKQPVELNVSINKSDYWGRVGYYLRFVPALSPGNYYLQLSPKVVDQVYTEEKTIIENHCSQTFTSKIVYNGVTMYKYGDDGKKTLVEIVK